MEHVIHEERKQSFFEKYLTGWVILCIGLGIALGKLLPQVAVALDQISIYQVSIPIAICLFFMMYPIMVKIDFAEVIKAGKTPKPVILTLVVNWCIKPFTITMLFLYAPLGGWLLGVNKMPIPWQTIVLSVVIYVGLPLLLGYYSRKWLIAKKGFRWFEEKFLHYLTPVSIGALLLTLILLFSFKG